MLTAIVLALRPVSDCLRLPQSHGAFAHSAARESIFLRLAPHLYEQMGKSNNAKPLTVSPLLGDIPLDRETHELCLSPECVYAWRLTGLDRAVGECLQRVTPDLGPIRMGNLILDPVAVLGDPQVPHPFAGDVGCDTYEALEEWWAAARPPESVALQFLTPTAFARSYFLAGRTEPGADSRRGGAGKQGGFEGELPFPLPRQVFGSLADRWLAHAGAPPRELVALLGPREAASPDAARELFERAVIPGRWEGQTHGIYMKHRGAVGFTGRFQYRACTDHPGLRRLLGLLADFAFYAGVGIETGNGMGQARMIDG